MNTLIKYLKSIGYSLLGLALLTIIIGTFNYFNIINLNVTNVLEVLALNISIFVGGFYLGKSSNSKGYLEGIKYGLGIIILLILLNYLILHNKFEIIHILFYLLILASSILSSILGINQKNQ